MRFGTTLIAGTLALGVAACSSPRPEGSACRGACPRSDGPTPLFEKSGDGAAASRLGTDGIGDQLRALMQQKADTVPTGVPERALADIPRAEDGRLDLLILSAGGPYGAFGAGFLNGWSGQTAGDLERPGAFDVVAGVSAGAFLATHAFLGRSGDAVLKEHYTMISTADVMRERWLIETLFSNSLFDTTPLRRTLGHLVTPALLDDVAEATALEPGAGEVGRLLLVLALDLDSGLPRILDLGAIAREKNDPDRIERYIDALMASAAIPIAFPPVFINGALHADGGTRLILFFNRYIEQQRLLIEGRSVAPPRLNIILSSELFIQPACTENTLLGVGKRSFAVVQDRLALDSLYRAIDEAERDGIEVRHVTAEGSGCMPPADPADMFRRDFLQCLFAQGERVGSGPSPWKTGAESIPRGDFSDLAPGLPACSAG